MPTWALYSFFQLLAWCAKDWQHGNIFFHTAVANRVHVPGDSNSKGKRQFPLPAEKSLCHFWNVQVQLKTSGLSSWRKETLKRRPCSHLHPPPSVIKHQSHKCLGKAFPKLPRRLLFCKRVNASQMQTTLDWISELVCSAFTCMLEVAKFWYIPLDWNLWFSMQRFFQTWTKPCVAVFSNHLQNWNLWFFRVTFLGWVLNFVGGSLWNLPLCLKLGSQIVPQPGPSKVEKKAGPPHGSSAVFLVASQISRAADFKNHFPNSILRCHSLY